MLFKEQAMLLPTIHGHFNDYARELLTAKHTESDSHDLLSSQWLLSTLTVKVQHHIAYSCKVRKYGTLVYSPNSDLSECMWKLQNFQSATSE